MHFTREPIIENIITPREGYKLVVRCTSGGQEEFFVDMIEVISFGAQSFYRSLEKPKCFVVPAGDYEIVEVRETRMVLKTSSVEKGIKIAGGKSTPAQKEEEKPKREKRKSRKRKEKPEEKPAKESKEKESATPKEVKTSLIPPPATLISEGYPKAKEETLIPPPVLEQPAATQPAATQPVATQPVADSPAADHLAEDLEPAEAVDGD